MGSVINFTIPDAPYGKARPRHNSKTGVTYTPSETKRREEIVRAAYRAKCGSFMFPENSYIALRIYAYYGIPKSASKKKRADMLSGKIRPTIKPDWDNVGKLIADALNGVAYLDDKCIVDGMVRKFYAEIPRTDVVLEEINHE